MTLGAYVTERANQPFTLRALNANDQNTYQVKVGSKTIEAAIPAGKIAAQIRLNLAPGMNTITIRAISDGKVPGVDVEIGFPLLGKYGTKSSIFNYQLGSIIRYQIYLE